MKSWSPPKYSLAEARKVAGSGESSPVMQLQVPPSVKYLLVRFVFNLLSFCEMIYGDFLVLSTWR